MHVNSDRLLREKEAAAFLGMTPRALQQWRVKGQDPVYVKIGAAVRYRAKDLEAFIEARLCQHTAQAALLEA